MSSTSTTTNRASVQAGSCLRGGDGSICAFDSYGCPSNAIFSSPRELAQSGGGLAHGGACTTRTGTEERTNIGWCPGEGCTSDASACSVPSSFVPIDDRCTVRSDSTRGHGGNDDKNFTTLFGRCSADDTCYWSQNDCPEEDPSSWIPAYNHGNPPSLSDDEACTCDKVRVGACLDQEFYFCAVSAAACDGASEWINATSLRNHQSAPACFLCRALDFDKPPTTFDGITVKGDDNKGNQAVVIGVTVGTVGGLAALFGLAVLVHSRLVRRRGPRPATKTALDIVQENSTTVSEVHVGNQPDALSDLDG